MDQDTNTNPDNGLKAPKLDQPDNPLGTTPTTGGTNTSKRKKAIFSSLAVVAVLVLGTAGFFGWQRSNKKTDTHAATGDYPVANCAYFKSNQSAYSGCLDRSAEAKMTRLYLGLFDRQPDSGGLRYWSDLLTRGRSLSSIASYFASSAEFRSRYPNSTNTSYVQLLYKNVLGREADSGGLNYWVGVLNSGRISRADALLSFTESPENVSELSKDIRCFVANSTCTSGLLLSLSTKDEGGGSSGSSFPDLITNKKHLRVSQLGIDTGSRGDRSVRGWGTPSTNQLLANAYSSYYFSPISDAQAQKTPGQQLGFSSSNGASLSPDARKFAIEVNSSQSGDGLDRIKVENADGTGQKTLLQSAAGVKLLSWSPDSRYIVISGSVYTDSSHNYLDRGLYLIDTTSAIHDLDVSNIAVNNPPAGVRVITLSVAARAGTWSSKGELALSCEPTLVTYHRTSAQVPTCGDGDIAIVKTDGTNARIITSPAKRAISSLKWSPDGTQIAYSASPIPVWYSNPAPAYPKNLSITEVIDAANAHVILPFKILNPAVNGEAQLIDWR